MRRDDDEPMQFHEVIDDAALALVLGGADDPSLGRCGPGSSWRFLGNVYTPQCRAHDVAVRSAKAAGTNPVVAHIKALPLLPAAVGSYARKVTGL